MTKMNIFGFQIMRNADDVE